MTKASEFTRLNYDVKTESRKQSFVLNEWNQKKRLPFNYNLAILYVFALRQVGMDRAHVLTHTTRPMHAQLLHTLMVP